MGEKNKNKNKTRLDLIRDVREETSQKSGFFLEMRRGWVFFFLSFFFSRGDEVRAREG